MKLSHINTQNITKYHLILHIYHNCRRIDGCGCHTLDTMKKNNRMIITEATWFTGSEYYEKHFYNHSAHFKNRNKTLIRNVYDMRHVTPYYLPSLSLRSSQ